jgi:hypothetical protein
MPVGIHVMVRRMKETSEDGVYFDDAFFEINGDNGNDPNAVNGATSNADNRIRSSRQSHAYATLLAGILSSYNQHPLLLILNAYINYAIRRQYIKILYYAHLFPFNMRLQPLPKREITFISICC